MDEVRRQSREKGKKLRERQKKFQMENLGTHIHGQERLKLRPNRDRGGPRPDRTVTEVDRDRTETETWIEWCAKNRTVTGTAQPYYQSQLAH